MRRTAPLISLLAVGLAIGLALSCRSSLTSSSPAADDDHSPLDDDAAPADDDIAPIDDDCQSSDALPAAECAEVCTAANWQIVTDCVPASEWQTVCANEAACLALCQSACVQGCVPACALPCFQQYANCVTFLACMIPCVENAAAV